MLHTYKAKQLIRSDIHSVWNFISSPSNLTVITPGSMQLEIIEDDYHMEKMYAGQIIEYHVTPIANIRMHWASWLTHSSSEKNLSQFLTTGIRRLRRFLITGLSDRP